MKKITILLSILLSAAASIAQADDQVLEVARNEGWVTSYDIGKKLCFSKPQSGEGLLFIAPIDGTLELAFLSQKIGWVQEKKDYKVRMYTDRRGWDGTMQGLQNPSGLILGGVADSFLSALKAAARLALEVEGVRLGPYSLSGSSKTLESLSSCLREAKSGKYLPQEPIALPWNGLQKWSAADYGKTYESQGWTMVMQGQENLDGTATTYLSARNKNGQQTTAKLEGKWGEIGVLPLQGALPTVYFAAFSGGAHCCTSAVAITGLESYPSEVEVGTFDGDGPRLEDINGDGNFEVVSTDQRFLYNFGPYAASMPPTQIWLMDEDGSKFTDVTTQEEYRSYLRANFIRSLSRYDAAGEFEQASAAGILAAASHLNLFSVIRNEMAADLMKKPADGFDVCRTPDCPTERTYKSLYEMVVDRFAQWGYPTTSQFSQTTVDFYKDLASYPGFGSGTADSELSCEMGAYRFKETEGKVISFSGYEFSCDVETAITQGSTSLVSAFCSGEGMYSFDNYMFSRTLGGLQISNWRHDIASASTDNEEMKVCPRK